MSASGDEGRSSPAVVPCLVLAARRGVDAYRSALDDLDVGGAAEGFGPKKLRVRPGGFDSRRICWTRARLNCTLLRAVSLRVATCVRSPLSPLSGFGALPRRLRAPTGQWKPSISAFGQVHRLPTPRATAPGRGWSIAICRGPCPLSVGYARQGSGAAHRRMNPPPLVDNGWKVKRLAALRIKTETEASFIYSNCEADVINHPFSRRCDLGYLIRVQAMPWTSPPDDPAPHPGDGRRVRTLGPAGHEPPALFF